MCLFVLASSCVISGIMYRTSLVIIGKITLMRIGGVLLRPEGAYFPDNDRRRSTSYYHLFTTPVKWSDTCVVKSLSALIRCVLGPGE